MDNTYITINGVSYNIVDGGTKCSDCVVKDLCMTNSLPKGITFDCNSIHLMNIENKTSYHDNYNMTDEEAKEFYEDMEADYQIEQYKSGLMDMVEP